MHSVTNSIQMHVRLICIVAGFAILSCAGDVTPWKRKSQGTIVINTGMKERDVLRESTLKGLQPYGEIGSAVAYGGSDSVFDFVLAGEELRFHGCILYSFDVEKTPERRVKSLSMHGPDESWREMVPGLLEVDKRLQANGWNPIGRCESIEEWTRQKPRDVVVTPSGTSEAWTWIKGSREFTLSAKKSWGGIRWWQNSVNARVFSRTMHVATLSDEDLGRILTTRVETLSSGGYVFGVRTPPGWSPDFVSGGMEGRGFFHPQCRSSPSEDLSIRLSISEKRSEKLSERLDLPQATMRPLPMAHPRFESFSRHVSDSTESNSYYVFLDPGERIPLTIELVMYRARPASTDDLATLHAIVRSIHLIEPVPGVK